MFQRVSRRHIAGAASSLFALSQLPKVAAAQAATPVVQGIPVAPDSALDTLVGTMDPAVLLEALRTAPVTTPLFPEAYGSSMVSAWEDDSDLEGSLGGALVGGANAPLMLAFVVYPDVETAAVRLESMGFDAEEPPVYGRILGQAGVTLTSMFGPRTILQVATVHIWGYGMPILTDPEIESMGEAAPDPAYLHMLEARSVVHATIGLDHLRRVVSE